MSKQLEKALSIIRDKQLERSLSIVVGGYILSLGLYFIWCFYFYYERLDRGNYLLVVVAVVIAITAVYLFLLFIDFADQITSKGLDILSPCVNNNIIGPFFNSTCQYLRYIINLMIIKLNINQNKPIKPIDKNEPERKILAANNKEIKKQLEDIKKNAHSEQKRMNVLESKLDNSHEINDFANTSITELKAKLEFERKENDKLRKELKETIRNLRSKDEIILALRSKLKEVSKAANGIILEETLNKDSPEIKIKSKVDNTDLDSKGQEIIFKVQIISSATLLPINSPKLMGLKNVWEYEDGGLYKYTVGNEKDFKSASVLQSELRRMGFVGAFVVAFKNGKRITIREARKLLN